MRDINVRVWDGEQYHFMDFKDLAKGAFNDPENAIYELSTDSFDIDGADIYEGDIVLTPDCGDWMDDWIVAWDGWGLVLQSTQNPAYEEPISEWEEFIQIIGNIHENPELLGHESWESLKSQIDNNKQMEKISKTH